MQLFISFEGGEATGKSLQTRLLWEHLTRMGYSCSRVHEPGGTPLGDYLRPFIKGTASLSRVAELFLFSAARAELVSKELKAKLRNETIIIADRYVDSTIAYQGYGRGLKLSEIKAINDLSTNGILPDLTILLDMSPEDALLRRASQLRLAIGKKESTAPMRLDSEGESRFEDEPLEFHKRVRDGYLKLARKEPRRWLVVDASQSIESVESTIWNEVQNVIERLAPQATPQNRTLI